MMKPIICLNNHNTRSVYFFTLVLLLLAGCAPKPEDAVIEYLDNTFLDNNGKKAYKLLSSDDRKYKAEEEFISEIRRKNMFNEKILKKYRDQFAYEIVETKHLNVDTALVKVILTKPSAHNILHEMVTFAMTTSFTKMSEEEKNGIMQEQFGRIMKDSEIQVETEEREFIAVRENGAYKLYLNLGAPHKMAILEQKLKELELIAEEQERVIDYEGALKTYRSMLELQKDEYILARISEIEKIRQNTVTLGNKIQLGKLEVKPKKIEVRKINYDRKNWLDGNPDRITSEEEYFVLTFDVTNNCEGEVFGFYDESRYKKEHRVFDNYGNIMDEFTMKFDMESVEGYKHKKLPEGETAEVRAVCEAPLSRKATTYLWRIKLYTDNKKTEEFVYVTFGKGDINRTPANL